MSNEIYNFRMKLNLSREQLAKILGVTSTTIWNWENEKSTPRPLLMFAVKNIQDFIESKSWDYDKQQKKFFEDYCQCPHPEEARQRFGFSIDKFAEVLGCTACEYYGWIMEGKEMPLYYKKFIKFLLKKKEEGKL